LGFNQAIPEEDFDTATATATVIDLSFLGLFPKQIFQALRKYEMEIMRFNSAGDSEFWMLFHNLIAAIIYRPITIQKVIHIMLAQHSKE
jgi:hypothetical protein